MSGWLKRSRLKNPAALLLLAALIVFLQGCSKPGMKIYFVRHAEAGHNVVDQWKDVPRSEWPAYVGNGGMFTPKGEEQAVALVQKLKGLKFDLIAASPYWRTRHTILPYLQATGQKAEIWPELEETTYVPNAWTAPGAKPAPPNPKLFDGVSALELPDAERRYFLLRADDRNFLDFKDTNEETEIANDLAMSQKVIDLIKARFGNAPKTILLVGHGNAGSTLLRMLTTTKDIDPNIANTAVWMAEEQADGSFKLKMLNGKPYAGK